jgi:hypothetical protein
VTDRSSKAPRGTVQVTLARNDRHVECAWDKPRPPLLGTAQWLPGDPEPWHVVAVTVPATGKGYHV